MEPSPQQMLLLQLVAACEDIVVPDTVKGTLVGRTLDECRRNGWVAVCRAGKGFNKVTLTNGGRALANRERYYAV